MIAAPRLLTALVVALLFLLCFLFMGLILKLQARWIFGVAEGGVLELTGLFDGEQRCVFAPLAAEVTVELLPTAVAWRNGRPFDAVQLLWPDRNGFLPTEAGFDRRLLMAQPVVADLG